MASFISRVFMAFPALLRLARLPPLDADADPVSDLHPDSPNGNDSEGILARLIVHAEMADSKLPRGDETGLAWFHVLAVAARDRRLVDQLPL